MQIQEYLDMYPHPETQPDPPCAKEIAPVCVFEFLKRSRKTGEHMMQLTEQWI